MVPVKIVFSLKLDINFIRRPYWIGEHCEENLWLFVLLQSELVNNYLPLWRQSLSTGMRDPWGWRSVHRKPRELSVGNVIKEFIVGWSKLEETRIVPDFQDFCRRNRRNILLAIRITLNAIVFNAILRQRIRNTQSRHLFKIQLDTRNFVRFKSDRFLLEREKRRNEDIVEAIISSLMPSIENRGRLGTDYWRWSHERSWISWSLLILYIYSSPLIIRKQR